MIPKVSFKVKLFFGWHHHMTGGEERAGDEEELGQMEKR